MKNNVRFGFLVKKYVGIGQPEFKKRWFFVVIYFDFREKPKNRVFTFFGFFTKFKINHYKNHFFRISGLPIPTYFLTGNPNLTLFLAKNWPQKGVKSIFCWNLNFQKLASYKKTRFWPLSVPLFIKNNVRFGFLVKKYVGIGQPEIQNKWFCSVAK